MATLTQLAEQALASAQKLDAFAASKSLPPTSFLDDTLIDLPLELEAERKNLVNASQSMKRLSLGAVASMLETLFTFTDLQALHYIYHNNIAIHVPTDSSISITSLAQATNTSPTRLSRFLRHAMTSNIFTEPSAGQIAHTAISRLLATSPGAMDTVGFLLEDLAPASLQTVAAYNKWPSSEEPNETGFNLAESTRKNFYEKLAESDERARRFGEGMRFMTKGTLYSLQHLIDGYDWSSHSSIVDVGGGHGSVSIALAKAFPHLSFTVQDLPGTVTSGAAQLPSSLRDRVKFMPHDFFSPQPVLSADVYFFRFIFHNWADKYAIQLLSALTPALKKGARLIIYEFLPESVGRDVWSEKQPRNLDMIQALGWNSLERTREGWEELFGKADRRWRFVGTRTPRGSAVSLIEAEWTG